MNNQTWRKSSYSGAENNCVEVAPTVARWKIRDSKNPLGGTLLVHPEALIAAAKAGRFDR
jgi:hypothetical protein